PLSPSSPTRRSSDLGASPRHAMLVDVLTEIEIDCPRDEVVAYAADPAAATAWYKNIEAVEWKSDPTLGVGSRVAFVARFLGRRLDRKSTRLNSSHQI